MPVLPELSTVSQHSPCCSCFECYNRNRDADRAVVIQNRLAQETTPKEMYELQAELAGIEARMQLI